MLGRCCGRRPDSRPTSAPARARRMYASGMAIAMHPLHPARPYPGRRPALDWRPGCRRSSCPPYRAAPAAAAAVAAAGRERGRGDRAAARPARGSWTRSWPLPRLALETEQQSTDGTRKYPLAAARRRVDRVGAHPLRASAAPSASPPRPAAPWGACSAPRAAWASGATSPPSRSPARSASWCSGTRPTSPPTSCSWAWASRCSTGPRWTSRSRILNSPDGFGIGARHITVSTVGIVPGMEALAARPEQFRLAISLHAAGPARRLPLMPIEKKYDLADGAQGRGGVPQADHLRVRADRRAERHRRGRRRAGERWRAGWVRWSICCRCTRAAHPDLTPTPPARIRAFADRLRDQGIEAVVRRSRGLDISAACGQLRVDGDGAEKRPAQRTRSGGTPPLARRPEPRSRCS